MRGVPVDNITHLPDKDITKDPLRISEGEGFITIAKPGGDRQALTLTPEEEQFLYAYMMNKRHPWTGPGVG